MPEFSAETAEAEAVHRLKFHSQSPCPEAWWEMFKEAKSMKALVAAFIEGAQWRDTVLQERLTKMIKIKAPKSRVSLAQAYDIHLFSCNACNLAFTDSFQSKKAMRAAFIHNRDVHGKTCPRSSLHPKSGGDCWLCQESQ
jgi:hypothetical protein